MDDWVGMYGSELLGREQGFRDAVGTQIGNYKSKIKQVLREYFLCLEDTSADTMREAFRKGAWSISLRDTVDAFAIFGGLDARFRSD